MKFSKILILFLCAVFLINLTPTITTVNAEDVWNEYCVFNTPDVSESFNKTSIFAIETSTSNEEPSFNITLSGNMNGATKCKLTVFDSNGNLSETTQTETGELGKTFYPLSASMRDNLLSGKKEVDFTSPEYNKILEEPFNVKLPKSANAAIYYIVVEPTGCDVKLSEEDSKICKIREVNSDEYELINSQIASKYYNFIIVKPMYLFPESVGKYIDNVGDVDHMPFGGYENDILSYAPDGWYESFIGTVGALNHVVANGSDIVAKIIEQKVKSNLRRLGVPQSAYDDGVFNQTDYDSIWLEQTYGDILENLTPIYDEKLIDSLNSTEAMANYKRMSSVILSATDVSSLKKLPEMQKYTDLIDAIEKSNTVRNALNKINSGLNWWETGEDFLSLMLISYDGKAEYINALDSLFADSDLEAHKKAISEIKRKYSEDFVERFWKLAEDSLFNNIAEYGIESTLGSISYWKAIETGWSIAMDASGFGAEVDRCEKIKLTAPIYAQIENRMSIIHDKRLRGEETEEELSEYACLFDIAKSLRVYQFEAIKKASTQDTKDNVSRIVNEIKGMYLSYDPNGKNGIEYSFASSGADGNRIIFTFTKEAALTEQPYLLYNGKGVDLKIGSCSDYMKNVVDGSITEMIGDARLIFAYRTNSANDDEVIYDFELDKIVTTGQEIDFSDYGVPEGCIIVGWGLEYDDINLYNSEEECEQKIGRDLDFSESDRVSLPIAYNYIIN